MPDVLSQLPDQMSVARADLPAGRVMLIPPICTMGEDAHFAQYDLFRDARKRPAPDDGR
jgi:hypothetical protein